LKDFVHACLRRAIDVETKEVAALLWAFAYFFAIMCAYFILRPVRDDMAIAGGVRALPWLFTGTFIVMLCVVPFFGALVSRFPRRKFIPIVYWFFIANLLVFWALLQSGVSTVYVARAFFIWTSVFNLFIVSVFWSFMVDLFCEQQGRRLFGFVAAGGTAGTLVGPLVTLSTAAVIGTYNLLLVSVVFLVFALSCVGQLLKSVDELNGRSASKTLSAPSDEHGIDGGIFSGVTEIAKSPYMIGIGIFIALFTWTSTFLYFQQANIIASAFDNSLERTQVFAAINLAVSTLTILTQIFITGRFMKAFGVRIAVAFLPAVTMVGFALFALAPTLAMLIVFQVIRRASNFAITRPGREMLFTVVTKEQKYKSKNFIDTVVYRGGDAVSGWAFVGLNRGLSLDLSVIAAICVPIAAAWMGLAWVLGNRQMRLAKTDRDFVISPAQ